MQELTPEEKFNKDVWSVLKSIRERSLYTRKDEPIEYWIDFDVVAAGYPMAKDEAAILEKLEEWGALHIRNQGGNWEYE